MTKQELEALVAQGPVLLDGAMGSCLLELGMPKGTLSELWADQHPEVVLELQAAYAAAGSRILYAPTFQAQPATLEQAGWTGDVAALNARLVRLTRRAAGKEALVAGDLAPMAGCMESWVPENFHRMTELYRRQIGGLLEGGADLLAAETLLYPQEAEAVLLAAEAGGRQGFPSSTALPCSRTALCSPAGRRGLCSGSWRRPGPPPWASTVWRRGRLCRRWYPSSAGTSGGHWRQAQCGQSHGFPRGSGGVSHGPGRICPASGGGPPDGGRPSGRLLRHHSCLPGGPPEPSDGRGFVIG